jgi:hypothetical protein
MVRKRDGMKNRRKKDFLLSSDYFFQHLVRVAKKMKRKAAEEKNQSGLESVSSEALKRVHTILSDLAQEKKMFNLKC